MTSNKQISLFGEDILMFYRADSRANRSALQESEEAQRITVTSGLKCLEQLERLPQIGLWAKTFVGLLVGTGGWYSTRCALTWKLLGTKSCRYYCQLVASMPPTAEKEYGLLPTVQTQGLKRCNAEGMNEFMPLTMLPTPTAIDSGSGRVNKSLSSGAKERPTIALMAKKGLLPTPTATGYNGSVSPEKLIRKDGKLRSDTLRNLPGVMGLHKAEDGSTFQLNPQFVAEMMGFPPDWTVLPFQSGESSR